VKQMRKSKINDLSTEELLSLKDAVDKALEGKRRELERQIWTLGGSATRGRGASLKGRKVAPKYRDRQGNTWAGRGARPRWLLAALKKGRKLESFAVK